MRKLLATLALAVSMPSFATVQQSPHITKSNPLGIYKVEPQQKKIPTAKVNSYIFLTACAGGIPVKDEKSFIVALANCTGRVQGFVAGHIATLAFHADAQNDFQEKNKRAATEDVPLEQWFCIPSNQMSDEVIMTNVLSWIEEDEIDFTGIMKTAQSPMEGALTVVIMSLHDKFPCKK